MLGLLHDVGKIFLEHYFKQEFERVMLWTLERKSGMFAAEQTLLDITHAEIGGMLGEKWKVDPAVAHAVRHHHTPALSGNGAQSYAGAPDLLSVYVAAADSLANMYGSRFTGTAAITVQTFEELPEWCLLQSFPAIRGVEFDLGKEVQKVQETVAAILDEAKPPPSLRS
jgi:hypothetical protein